MLKSYILTLESTLLTSVKLHLSCTVDSINFWRTFFCDNIVLCNSYIASFLNKSRRGVVSYVAKKKQHAFVLQAHMTTTVSYLHGW